MSVFVSHICHNTMVPSSLTLQIYSISKQQPDCCLREKEGKLKLMTFGLFHLASTDPVHM